MPRPELNLLPDEKKKKPTAKVSSIHDERREILGSEVAGRFGRGNTAIQDLGMLTRNDLDREILEVRGLTFAGR